MGGGAGGKSSFTCSPGEKSFSVGYLGVAQNYENDSHGVTLYNDLLPGITHTGMFGRISERAREIVSWRTFPYRKSGGVCHARRAGISAMLARIPAFNRSLGIRIATTFRPDLLRSTLASLKVLRGTFRGSTPLAHVLRTECQHSTLSVQHPR